MTRTPFRPRLCGPEVSPSVPLVPGILHLTVEVDTGDAYAPVGVDDLASWRTTLVQLLPIAIRRLASDTPASSWHEVDTVPGMLLQLAEDGNAAARLLVLDDVFHAWPVGGVAVAVPSADQLLVVPLHDADDLDALNVMITAARFAWEANDAPLTDQVFWTDGRSWHHVEVEHYGDDVEVQLPDALRASVGRLAATGLIPVAAEA